VGTESFSGRSRLDRLIPALNHGDYYRAVEDKMNSENITKDVVLRMMKLSRQELRLAASIFFASCSLQNDPRASAADGRWTGSTRNGRASSMTRTGHCRGGVNGLLVDEHQMDGTRLERDAQYLRLQTTIHPCPKHWRSGPVGLVRGAAPTPPGDHL